MSFKGAVGCISFVPLDRAWLAASPCFQSASSNFIFTIQMWEWCWCSHLTLAKKMAFSQCWTIPLNVLHVIKELVCTVFFDITCFFFVTMDNVGQKCLYIPTAVLCCNCCMPYRVNPVGQTNLIWMIICCTRFILVFFGNLTWCRAVKTGQIIRRVSVELVSK